MKLTAVTIRSGNKKLQTFIKLPYSAGRPVLPFTALNKLLDQLGVRNGECYSIS